MRYISSVCLEEGMVVGKSVFNKDNKLLVGKGVLLRKNFIKRLNEEKILGIYIMEEHNKIELNRGYLQEIVKEKIYYMFKNFVMYEISQEKSKLIEELTNDTINNNDIILLLMDIYIYDYNLFDHCLEVGIYSIILGIAVDLRKKDLCDLILAGLLHDYGKLFIDKKVYNKTSKLTIVEYNSMKEHSYFGYNYLKQYDLSTSLMAGILDHHENYDGSGYPNNKAREDISLFGRIISISDKYQALISNRPYRKALLSSEAMEYIMGDGGGIFDPKLCKCFCTSIAAYPIGRKVYLSNGILGEVVAHNYGAPLRPKIKIIDENDKTKESIELNNENCEIDLGDMKNSRNITIIGWI